jgi:hydrogenase maturation factor
LDDYKKLIFETDDISISVLKLGEDSNLALFFKKEKGEDLKLQSIRRYIHRIENLIDMDKIELKLQELGLKEEEFRNLQNILSSKLELFKNSEELDIKETLDQELKKKSKDIESLEQECAKINLELELKKKEIDNLKEQIDEERKQIQKD